MKDEKDLSGTSLTVGASVSVSASESATARHTPGPWYLQRVVHRPGGEPISPASVFGLHGGFVADCGSHENANANAHLIAAAPELLEALKEMREACCAAMRVVADLDMAERLGWSAEQKQQRFIDELHFAGVKDGFGVRAQNAIAKAEGRS